ncbi:MAG: DUF5060 domain-containing protein [Flavobacteriales bacterium]
MRTLIFLFSFWPVLLFAEPLNVAWINPSGTTNEVGKHKKLELGVMSPSELNMFIGQFFRNKKIGLNPFEPNDINVEAAFEAPSGNVRKIYGFYYRPYQADIEQDAWKADTSSFDWRIRFAPDEIGEWSVTVSLITKEKALNQSTTLKFSCLPSQSRGYLCAEKGKRILHFSEKEEPFFAIGHNITHASYDTYSPKDAVQHLAWLKQLADNGGNFFRLELGGQCYLPDWYDAKDYSRQMPAMWQLDKIFEFCEDAGLYFILFRHHVELMKGYGDWEIVQWDNNPYKNEFGISRDQYFKDPEMLRLQKNTLRYIFSRWGYSTNFAMYSYSELDNFYKDYMKDENLNEKQALTTLTAWLKEIRDYYKEDLGYERILYMNTYASLAGAEKSNPKKFAFNLNDVNGIHKYGETKDMNYKWNYNEAHTVWKKWKKPFIFEEMGYNANSSANSDYVPFYCCTPIDFYQNTWATSFMGTFGTGMHWWWDRGIHLNEYYKVYNNLDDYFKHKKNGLKSEINVYRWRNKKSTHKTLVESYYLKNADKNAVYGWVANASYHWRNLMESDNCMKHIKTNEALKEPCVTEDNIRMAEKGIKADFRNPRFEDKYTSTGGPKPLKQNEGILKVKGLKKRKKYSITFYPTTPESTVKSAKKAQTYRTNLFGTAKIFLPPMDASNPSYAYKIYKQPKYKWGVYF